jgi:hypothetical protein
MTVLYLLGKFWETPYNEKILLIKGFGIILILNPLISILPLKYYASIFKSKSKECNPNINKKSCIKKVRKTLNRLDGIIPFPLSCLVKSATFRILLNSLGVNSRIVFGVNKSESFNLKAHACILIDDYPVYLKKADYTQVLSL